MTDKTPMKLVRANKGIVGLVHIIYDPVLVGKPKSSRRPSVGHALDRITNRRQRYTGAPTLCKGGVGSGQRFEGSTDEVTCVRCLDALARPEFMARRRQRFADAALAQLREERVAV